MAIALIADTWLARVVPVPTAGDRVIVRIRILDIHIANLRRNIIM
jgi:hypothetical protein